MSTQDDAPDSPAESHLSQQNCHVALTHGPLNLQTITDLIRSPQAGAIVIFAGTTRDTFDAKPVSHLSYSAYHPLALRTMLAIAADLARAHGLQGIAMVHRLGAVPVGEESIVIAVSAAHRQAAWRAGEAALEACKARVEVWKREEFAAGGGVWRANRDGVAGEREA
ncbi:Molybdopterin biosynthesis MoaE [Trichocladium antarcticum]|uniref:Molybdopterin synthase catalytic subunit n=1 Tax=Trichocladium antarcticum TaxID=1450529 RepID=A0AAN6ZG14_9PEZI|nr:Molybdopterin biosynthesis MoaE [Trichocladium antarcticum]